MHACTSMWSVVTKIVFSEEMWCVILDYLTVFAYIHPLCCFGSAELSLVIIH